MLGSLDRGQANSKYSLEHQAYILVDDDFLANV
jgi:hypothetical protein